VLGLTEAFSAPARCSFPSGAAAEAAADALVQQALQAGTSDNVTALVMLLDWAGQPPQQQQAA
jgi:serine/threonine protein phosphatase PrpC